MKTNSGLLLAAIFLIAIMISMNQCKSPVAQQETAPVVPNDTASVVDTVKAHVQKSADTITAQVPLTLLISNLTSATAPVIVGVYGTENKFPDPNDQMRVYKFTPDSISFKAQITDLPFGDYALAIYQDVNSNGKIDKNVIGIPTEPYAFSNNYRPTIKAPGFKNCQFEYSANVNMVTMKMIK